MKAGGDGVGLADVSKNSSLSIRRPESPPSARDGEVSAIRDFCLRESKQGSGGEVLASYGSLFLQGPCGRRTSVKF